MYRKATFTGANKVLLAFTCIFMVAQFLLIIPTMIYGADFINKNIYNILLVNQYVIILIPVLVYTFSQKLDVLRTFRIKSPGLIPSLLIIVITPFAYVAAGMLNTVFVYFLQFIGDIPAQPFPTPSNLRQLIFALFVICISPAICEELLHRGIMLSGYERRGSMRAVFLTAFMFGIFHFDMTNFFGPVLLGILIAYYVVRTDSIFAGMIAHFLNNALAVLTQYFSGNAGQEQKILKVSAQELTGALLYGMIGLIIGATLLYLFMRVTNNRSVMKPALSSIKKDIVATISHWPVIVILSVYMFILLLTLVSGLLTKVLGTITP